MERKGRDGMGRERGEESTRAARTVEFSRLADEWVADERTVELLACLFVLVPWCSSMSAVGVA